MLNDFGELRPLPEFFIVIPPPILPGNEFKMNEEVINYGLPFILKQIKKNNHNSVIVDLN